MEFLNDYTQRYLDECSYIVFSGWDFQNVSDHNRHLKKDGGNYCEDIMTITTTKMRTLAQIHQCIIRPEQRGGKRIQLA